LQLPNTEHRKYKYKLKKRIEDKNKTRRKKNDKIEELLLETGQTDKRVHVCGSCLLHLSIQFDLKNPFSKESISCLKS